MSVACSSVLVPDASFAGVGQAMRTIDATSVAPRAWACCNASSADAARKVCSAMKVTVVPRPASRGSTPASPCPAAVLWRQSGSASCAHARSTRSRRVGDSSPAGHQFRTPPGLMRWVGGHRLRVDSGGRFTPSAPAEVGEPVVVRGTVVGRWVHGHQGTAMGQIPAHAVGSGSRCRQLGLARSRVWPWRSNGRSRRPPPSEPDDNPGASTRPRPPERVECATAPFDGHRRESPIDRTGCRRCHSLARHAPRRSLNNASAR
jgi:hypothetical protein